MLKKIKKKKKKKKKKRNYIIIYIIYNKRIKVIYIVRKINKERYNCIKEQYKNII